MQDHTAHTEAHEANSPASAWFVLVLSVAIGAGLALLSAKSVFQAIPTDLSRIGVILDALHDENLQPEFVAFGTSVTMASVDTKVLSARLEGHPQGLNLATTGQSPMESYLYYQELPDSVSLIIQIVHPTWFNNSDQLEPQKYNTFYMFDYDPDSRTEAGIVDIFGLEMEMLFAKSSLQQRFDSRWAVRQMLDRMARSALRSELTLNRSIYDLEHPSTGAPRLPTAVLQRAVKIMYGTDEEDNGKYRAGSKKQEFLAEMVRRAKIGGRQIVLVLGPVHPAAYDYATEDYYKDVRRRFELMAEENDTPLIDALDIVPGDLFSDAAHPTDEGAVIMSNFLADKIAELYSAGTLHE
jgi:hypothetical protein